MKWTEASAFTNMADKMQIMGCTCKKKQKIQYITFQRYYNAILFSAQTQNDPKKMKRSEQTRGLLQQPHVGEVIQYLSLNF